METKTRRNVFSKLEISIRLTCFDAVFLRLELKKQLETYGLDFPASAWIEHRDNIHRIVDYLDRDGDGILLLSEPLGDIQYDVEPLKLSELDCRILRSCIEDLIDIDMIELTKYLTFAINNYKKNQPSLRELTKDLEDIRLNQPKVSRSKVRSKAFIKKI